MTFNRSLSAFPASIARFRPATIAAALAIAQGLAMAPAMAESLNQNFEAGLAGWFADNGVWEVGTPAGQPGCHSGAQCAGTILNGNYPFSNSRLVSTPVQLDGVAPGQFLSLRFWHWFAWGSATGGLPGQGYVQVSTFDPVHGWSAWVNASPAYSGTSGVWTATQVDMTPYAGKQVRIGFLHLGANSFNSGPGWYIDDVIIPGVVCTNALNLSYSAGTLNIEAINGTTVAGTWNLSLASRNKITRLRSEPIAVTDPPTPTSVSIPDFRPAGEVGVLSSINLQGKGIACSAWKTVPTSAALD